MHAQKDSSDNVAKNAVYIEFLGNAAGDYHRVSENFSINYDRMLHVGRIVRTSIRIGTNIPRMNYTYRGSIASIHVIPFMFNLLIGRRVFFGEMGMGGELIYVNSDYKVAYGAFTSTFGIRFLGKSRIVGRLGLSPTLGIVKSSIYVGSFVGGSIGYLF